jgi:cytochrome d ubiquinol oxidase subunit II
MDLFNFGVDLNTLAFLIVGLLITGYAMLDGFDLGVGALHLFSKGDLERRTFLNAIGPVWDGNEVWLVTGGGALFASFPEAYATVFSGFYVPFMALLATLIFRAVAIEFRSKQPMPWWRTMWDVSFAVSSTVSAVLLGVALGNIALGVPLDARHIYAGGFFNLLNPYALMVGLTTLALFMMHANIYLLLKTEGALHDKVRDWSKNTMAAFIILYIITTMATMLYVPQMTDKIRANPLFFSFAVCNALAIANIPRQIYKGQDGWAFLFSCVNILFLMGLFGLGIFPNIVLSNPTPENSLTLYNAASSQDTLRNIALIAVMGVPLVLAYTGCVYWIFRGKVKLDAHSY